MWPNQRDPFMAQPDAFRAQQQMQRGQQMQQMAMQQPGTGWAGLAMALMGGFGGRRMEERGYEQMVQAMQAQQDREMQKREAVALALSGQDPRAAIAPMLALGMGEQAVKLAGDLNKPKQVPDALWNKFTESSIEEYINTGRPSSLKPKSDGPENLSKNMMWDAQRGMAVQIPGTEAWHASQETRARTPSTVVTIAPGQSHMSLTKENTNAVQKRLINLQARVAKLRSVSEQTAPDALTVPGRIANTARDTLDWLGVDIGNEHRQKVGEVAAMTAATEDLFNNYMVEVYGTTATDAAMNRLRQTYLNTDMGPAKFAAMTGALFQTMEEDIKTQQDLLRLGASLEEARAFMEPTRHARLGLDEQSAPAVQSDLQADLNAVRGSAPNADTPPVAGARKAPDGKWYVQQGTKWYEVEL